VESNNLYILGGNDTKLPSQIKKTSKVIFFDKEQKGFVNQFSLIKNFYEQQDFLREKWLILQEKVFKKIQPSIDKDEDFRYILSNLFFEASPYKTNVMYQFFKLYLIIDYIKKENIENVFLLNLPQDINAFFNANIKKLSISVKIIDTKKNNLSIKNLIKSFSISSLFYRLFVECRIKRQKIFPQKNQASKAVFSYYSRHSINNSISSKYFADVSSLLNNNDYSWLFLYVDDVSKLGKESNMINKNTYGFLDAYFLLSDFKNVIFDYYRIKKKLRSIKLKELFVLEGVDYLCLIKNDWLISIKNILLDVLIFEKKFTNFFKSNPNIKEFIYLLEFQPWELMLNKVAHKHGIKTKGVTHAVVRSNLLQYFHPKSIHPFFYNPSYVGVNSDFCSSLFLQNGFSSNQVLKIEAQRFNYLVKAKKKTNNQKTQLRKSILITTSINPIETKELLEVFALCNVKFEKVYIKEHPNLPVKLIIDSLVGKFPFYELVTGSMSDAFQFSDIIYTANGSSVLLESVINEKHTVSLVSLSSLPMPAINKAPNLYFVYDVDTLSKILTQINLELKTTVQINDNSNHLYIDENLTLWREFLKK